MGEPKKKNLWEFLRYGLGFYRNPPYIEDQLREADVRSAAYLTAVVCLVEIAMILRYIRNWVLPGKVDSVGEFFHYTYAYWWLLGSALLILIYGVLYMKGKLGRLRSISSVLIFLYFSFAIYFGITTAMHDFSRGRMIICFLTMLMYVTVICVWRPFSSIAIIGGVGFLFVWLLNNRTFDKAGNRLSLSEGDFINYITFLIILCILVIAVYFQRYRDAKKSWELEKISVTDDLTGIPNMHKFDEDSKAYMDKSRAEGKYPVYLVFDLANFQTYNDRFDYNGGDELLVEMGNVIVSAFPGEPAARQFGDIFSVLTNAEDYR